MRGRTVYKEAIIGFIITAINRNKSVEIKGWTLSVFGLVFFLIWDFGSVGQMMKGEK